MSATAIQWLEDIHNLPLPETVRVMNVCGGHERSITMAGLRAALPENVELIPGPGCPVCVCPEEDVYEAIQIALHEDVILAAFGDMLRVPVNVGKNAVSSLEQAKAAGADVRPVATPMEPIQIAKDNPHKPVIFFATGFETTTAPVAAMLAQGAPDNLFLLLSARLTWPAIATLLDSEEAGFDALIAPGHVATIMGAREWNFVVEKHGIATAVSGFEPKSLLAAMYSVFRQIIDQRPFLDNCYPQVVRPEGNPVARKFLSQVLDITDANWRGVGIIPASGFSLNKQYQSQDARRRFPGYQDDARRRAGQMPPGCDCARVVMGKLRPDQCRLYGKACTPRSPIGPCMVSDEGACRIWWAGGIRKQRAA